MNRSMIRYILGHVMRIECILMLLPCVVALYYKEHQGFYYLLIAGISGLIGCLLTILKPKDTIIYLKEGCIITGLSWIIMSFIGSIPFYITGEIPNFVDALFETVSGFTTTGSSILNNVEALSHTALFWRSFTHWIGGMGVLVFLLAVIPMGGGSNINIMKAESPGPSVGKLVPKMKSSAMILYVIYLVITTIEVIFLLLGGMTLFEALTLSFGTAGTGGFGIMNDSFVSYSPYIQWVATIFMLLFGINFNAYYFLLFRSIKEFFMEEVKYYLLIVGVSTAIIFLHVINIYKSVATALRHSAFQVATIITTTGFASTDFDKWHSSCKFILVILMFIGACAGSTGGGIKVSRIVILVKSIGKEFASYIHPRIVKKVKFEGRPVEHEIVRSINVYLITYIVLFVASMFLVSIEGYDLTTSFTSVAATLNNIGPGLEKVGPTCNFSFYKPITKFVLMFDMLAGRLELFPMLLIFHPTIIKDFFTTSMKKKGFTNNLKTRKK